MAMIPEATGTRRSVLFTTSVAIVFAISESNDIDWIIKLSSLQAWLFLFAAHTYFSFMWLIRRRLYLKKEAAGQIITEEGEQKIIEHPPDVYVIGGPDKDTFFGRSGVDIRMWMARSFTDIFALIGLIVTASALVLAFFCQSS